MAGPSPGKTPALAGRWQGSEGEYVATIKGSSIVWPDKSQKEFKLELRQEASGDESQCHFLTFELNGEEYTAKVATEDRLEFNDGDVWLKPRKKPAAPRKRKAVEDSGVRRYKVASSKKVGILPKPDIEAEVKDYLQPGAMFEASEEWVDPRDERKFFFLESHHGWVPECSRKDVTKVVVVEHLTAAQKRAREAREAREAAASAAAAAASAAAEEAEEAMPEDGAEQTEAPETPAAPRRRLAAPPAAPISKEDLNEKVSKDVADITLESNLLETGEALVAQGYLPSEMAEQFSQLLKLPVAKLKSWLRAAWLPPEGDRQQVAVRLLRHLADWGPQPEDVSLFQEAGLVSAPARRMLGKHKDPVVLPAEPPSKRPLKRPLKRLVIPKRKAKAKAKGKAKAAKARAKPKVEAPPSIDELCSSGKLPEDSVERYDGLCSASLDELKGMAGDLWLPQHGQVHQLALRITRHMAELEPLEEDKEPEEPEEPTEAGEDAGEEAGEAAEDGEPGEAKAQPKRKLRAGKMGAASRLKAGGTGRGRGRAGRGAKRGAGRAFGRVAHRAPKVPKVPKVAPGPTKKKMRLFLTSYLDTVDIQTTTFSQLRASASEELGELSEEAVHFLRDLAAVAMRKRLGVRSRAAAPASPPEEAPASPEKVMSPEKTSAAANSLSPPKEEKQLGEAGTEAPQAQPDIKATEEAAKDAKKKDDSDSDSDSVSISPVDMASLMSPMSPAATPAPKTPRPKTPKQPKPPKPPKAPKVSVPKTPKVKAAPSNASGISKRTPLFSQVGRPKRRDEAKDEVKDEVKDESKDESKDAQETTKEQPTVTARPSARNVPSDVLSPPSKPTSFHFAKGTGQKLEDAKPSAEAMKERQERAEAQEQDRSNKKILLGIESTVSRFVQHSIVRQEKHEILAKSGHLSCRIRVRKQCLNQALKDELAEMVKALGGSLEDDREHHKVSDAKSLQPLALAETPAAHGKTLETSPEAPDPSATETRPSEAPKMENQETKETEKTETPMETPLETPMETPAEAAPTETPMETPAEAAPTETPMETPAEAAPTETPMETPAEAAPTETPMETPAEAAPTGNPMETPAEAAPMETSMETPAEAAPTGTPMETSEVKDPKEAEATEAEAKEAEGTPKKGKKKKETKKGTSKDKKLGKAKETEEGPRDLGALPATLGAMVQDNFVPSTPKFLGRMPGTPAFATAPRASEPVRKWVIKLPPQALESFLFSHPAILDITDAKFLKFAESCLERIDIMKFEVSRFFEGVQMRYGEQFPERKARMTRMLKKAVQQKVENDDKKRSSSKHLEAQKESKKSVGTKGGKEDSDVVVLLDAEKDSDEIPPDLKWAFRVLAPFGLDSDGALLVKPPPSQALPLLKGMRVVSNWPDLQKKLHATQVGRVVKCLQQHPHPNVAALARELTTSFRAECQRQSKLRKEKRSAAGGAAATPRAPQRSITDEHGETQELLRRAQIVAPEPKMPKTMDDEDD